jgi:hypothetical protein
MLDPSKAPILCVPMRETALTAESLRPLPMPEAGGREARGTMLGLGGSAEHPGRACAHAAQARIPFRTSAWAASASPRRSGRNSRPDRALYCAKNASTSSSMPGRKSPRA